MNTIIEQFELEPHPEGGFFKETYRSDWTIPPNALDPDIEGERNYCTGIFFLLSSSDFSDFHKINQDEMWHFYKGSPLKIHMITPNGVYSYAIVGNAYEKDQAPQFTVPAKYWFAAEVLEPDSFSQYIGNMLLPRFCLFGRAWHQPSLHHRVRILPYARTPGHALWTLCCPRKEVQSTQTLYTVAFW